MVGLRPTVSMWDLGSQRGFLLRDPSPYLIEFIRENREKLSIATSTSATGIKPGTYFRKDMNFEK